MTEFYFTISLNKPMTLAMCCFYFILYWISFTCHLHQICILFLIDAYINNEKRLNLKLSTNHISTAVDTWRDKIDKQSDFVCQRVYRSECAAT